MNLGNPILANKGVAAGTPGGMRVNFARFRRALGRQTRIGSV
jgi:hypothetical protein